MGIVTSGIYAPLLPHIQVAPERISSTPLFTLPVIGEFYMTNTLLATFIVDIILLLIALAVRKATSSGSMVPGGISGAVEAFLEVLYNLTESTAGKWAKTIFPYFATITMMVLFANWLELIPGVDSLLVAANASLGADCEGMACGN
jgi:F-type H+-transporting ATPase subunit a